MPLPALKSQEAGTGISRADIILPAFSRGFGNGFSYYS